MFRRPNGRSVLDTSPRMLFFTQAAFVTAFTYLTSGVYLSGLALLMGAGDLLVSYLSISISICGILILAFSAFLERFRSRKRLTVVLTFLSRSATLLIVTIPVLVPAKFQLVVLVPVVLVAFALQAQTTVVLNQWMVGFLDNAKSGRYISLRQTLTLIVTVVLSLTGGWWMDYMEGRYLGFVILFAVAALMGAMDLLLLVRIPDGEPYHPSQQRYGILDILRIPLRDRRYAGFVLYIAMFYFLLNIADSFTMVYMMKYLALPYQTVTSLFMLISLPQIGLLGVWGRLSDRLGHGFVLKTSIWLFVGEMLFMFFVSPRTWFVFIPLSFLIAAAANAGFVVAVFNRRYELMPGHDRIAYDNFYSAGIGLGVILGPLVGGAIKRSVEANALVTKVMPFANIRILYLVAAVGILSLQFIWYRAERKQRIGEEVSCCCCPEQVCVEKAKV